MHEATNSQEYGSRPAVVAGDPVGSASVGGAGGAVAGVPGGAPVAVSGPELAPHSHQGDPLKPRTEVDASTIGPPELAVHQVSAQVDAGPDPDELVRVRPPGHPQLPAKRPGARSGELYTGGVPRELRRSKRNGMPLRNPRVTAEFNAKMRSMADSKALARALRTILCDPDHEQFARVAELVIERGYGKVPQKVEADHTHRHAVVLLPQLDPLPSIPQVAAQVVSSALPGNEQRATLPAVAPALVQGAATIEPQAGPSMVSGPEVSDGCAVPQENGSPGRAVDG